jgi:hypothetical protein
MLPIDMRRTAPDEPLHTDDAPDGAPTSRRRLIQLTAAAGAAALGAAAGTELITPSVGAASGDAIDIDDTTTGAGGTTILEYTSGSSTLGAAFRAAVEDWGGQVYNVVAYGAAGDGTTDDTAAIQAAITAAHAGCVLFPSGTYLVSGLTVTTAGASLRLEAGATVIAKAGISGPVIAVSAPSVSIFGPGVVDGNQGAQTGTTNLDCIQFQAGADDGLVQGIVAQNAAFRGIATVAANRARIALNRVINCNHGGITCTATSASIDGPFVVGNMVTLTGAAVIAGINVGGSGATVLVNNPTVSDNRVSTVNSGLAYQVQFCPFARVVGNWGTSPGQVFSVVGGTDNVVSSNVAVAIGPAAGIELGSTFSVCTGNTIIKSGPNASGCGINCDKGSGTTVAISNNKIVGALSQAILVGSYDHVTITGNVLTMSPIAKPGFGVVEVSPSGPGLVVIADNVMDANNATQFGVILHNLTATSIQTTIHDNTIAGIPSTVGCSPFRFNGAGAVTDLLVHDNLVSTASTTALYTILPGLTLGNNVRFHHNTSVGVPTDGTLGLGLTPLSLPASGTPYTNPGPYTEIVYIQGGKLSGTGSAQGIVKNGHVIAQASIVLKIALAVTLDPGESITVYYSVAPNTFKDVKG